MKSSATLAAAITLALALGSTSASVAVRTVTIRVTGMTWEGCARSVEQALKKTDGVLEAQVSFPKGEARIRYDDRKVSVAKLKDVINGTGFKAAGVVEATKPPAARRKRGTTW